VTSENKTIHDFHHFLDEIHSHDEILIQRTCDEISHDSLDEIDEKAGEDEKDE
jgi:hypothetical protein